MASPAGRCNARLFPHAPSVPFDPPRIGARVSLTRRALASLVLVFALAATADAQLSLLSFGAREKENPYGATSSTAARSASVRAMPWNEMTPDARIKAWSCVANHTVYRRLPTCVIQCDSNMYWFLVNHPDVVVNVWETLGITQLAVRETSPHVFHMVDEAGTVGSVEYLYRSPKRLVIYTDGQYEGPLFGSAIRGKTVLVLSSQYTQAADGKQYVTCHADCYVKIDNTGAEFIARLFQPLVGRVVDNNFVQTAGFLGDFSRTAEVNPKGVARLAQQLSNVRPELRDQLAALSTRVAERAIARERQRIDSVRGGGVFEQAAGTTPSTEIAAPATQRRDLASEEDRYPRPHAVAEANAAYYATTPAYLNAAESPPRGGAVTGGGKVEPAPSSVPLTAPIDDSSRLYFVQ